MTVTSLQRFGEAGSEYREITTNITTNISRTVTDPHEELGGNKTRLKTILV